MILVAAAAVLLMVAALICILVPRSNKVGRMTESCFMEQSDTWSYK